MSYNISQPLTPVLLEDPVLIYNNNSYGIFRGGSKISYYQYTSSNISNTAITFVCQPPASNIALSRSIYCQIPIRITLSGLAYTSNQGTFNPSISLINPGLDAPRSMPMNSMLESANISINNVTINANLSDYIHPLSEHYNTGPTLKSQEYSTTPSYPDRFQSYSGPITGTIANPLGGMGNSLDQTTIPRGGFPFTVISNPTVVSTNVGTACTAIVDFVVFEPIQCSPMWFGKLKEETAGFFNVNNFQVTLQFLSNAAMRVWSHAANQAITTQSPEYAWTVINTGSIQFNNFTGTPFSYPQFGVPQIFFKDYTPSPLSSAALLGPLTPLTWPFSQVNTYPVDFSASPYSTSLATRPYNSQAILVSSIPNRIYVWVRASNYALSLSPGLTDSYFAITQCQVQWANQNTVLSSASNLSLYLTCVKNGLVDTWQQFSGLPTNNTLFPPSAGNLQNIVGSGSVLSLEFGTDIQLDGNTCIGLLGQQNLQVQVLAFNPNNTPFLAPVGAVNPPTYEMDQVPLQMWTAIIFEGTFSVPSLGNADKQIGVVSNMDVLDAKPQQGVNYRKIRTFEGGDFLSGLRDFGNKILDFFRGNKLISTVASLIPHPIAQVVGQVAHSAGYGLNSPMTTGYGLNSTMSNGYGLNSQMGGAVIGGNTNGGFALGGCATGECQGGKRMTKAQLRKNLMHR